MPPLHSLSKPKQAALDNIAPSFHLSDEKLNEITKRFLEEFAMGITAYNHPMAMIPTFVTGTPDGSEKGLVLSTPLRVALVHGSV